MKIDKEKIDLLKDLSNLLEKDLITKEEFENQKSLLLKPEQTIGMLLQGISIILRLFTPQFVAMLAILLFYAPINKLIQNASEVAFGDSFSFKVQNALNVRDPSLSKIVKKLNKDEIAALISTESFRVLVSTTMRYDNNKKEEISLDNKFDTYVSLQKKGLYHSQADLEKIKKLVQSKKMNYESESYDPLMGSTKSQYYSKELFSKEELDLLSKTSGHLTNAGQKVYWLIIDNTAEELSRNQ